MTARHHLGMEETRCRMVRCGRIVEGNPSCNHTVSHFTHAKTMSGSHWCHRGAHALLTLTIRKNMNFNVCRVKWQLQIHQTLR